MSPTRQWDDRSAGFLLLSNALTLVVALVQGWSLHEVMWIYWGQSLVIGFFNWRRILELRDFSTRGVRMNGRPVEATPAAKRQMATFFALHFGGFHAGYLAFLLVSDNALSGWQVVVVLACVMVFFLNHRYSFRYNLERDLARKPNIGTIFFFPYARIVPMHVTIIVGANMAGDSRWALVVFMGLKTLADWIMHAVEHRTGSRGAARRESTAGRLAGQDR